VDIAVDRHTCFVGEVGLSGEVRPVARLEQRINEAEKLSYQRIIVSKYSYKPGDFKKNKIEIIPAGKLTDVFKKLFG